MTQPQEGRVNGIRRPMYCIYPYILFTYTMASEIIQSPLLFENFVVLYRFNFKWMKLAFLPINLHSIECVLRCVESFGQSN